MDNETSIMNKTPQEVIDSNCIQSKKRYIIENKDLLGYKQRLSIIRIVQNDFDHVVQESGEGSYVSLDEIDSEIIDVIYNIVKTTIDRPYSTVS